MRPSHSRKSGRRYRYYVSRDLVERSVKDGARGWRIPAGEIESAVAHALAARLHGEIFYSLAEARIVIETWRRFYNTSRPHSSLGY